MTQSLLCKSQQSMEENKNMNLQLECSVLLQSCSVMSDSLWPHRLQYTRLPCPSPSPRACSNSCTLSQWCHPPISSSVVPFSCLQSFPASKSFPMSLLFASDGQSIGASSPASVLNVQGWFPLRLTGFISLLSGVFLNRYSWGGMIAFKRGTKLFSFELEGCYRSQNIEDFPDKVPYWIYLGEWVDILKLNKVRRNEVAKGSTPIAQS